MKRAIHRLQVVELLFDLDGRIHVFRVEPKVAAGLPEAGPSDVRGVDKVVTGFQVLLLAVLLSQMPDEAAFGMPEYQPAANGVGLNAE